MIYYCQCFKSHLVCFPDKFCICGSFFAWPIPCLLSHFCTSCLLSGLFLSFHILLCTRIRVFCHWLCNHSYFGNVILACIMISSAMLAAEDPLQSDTPRNEVSNLVMPYLFTQYLTMLYFIYLEYFYVFFHFPA
jgi:hypothetical protein